MSLKIFKVEDEPELEPVIVTEPEPEPQGRFFTEDEVRAFNDIELPESPEYDSDVLALTQSICALESFNDELSNGMTATLAEKLDERFPNFIRDAGGNKVFTHTPSLEGLAEGIAVVTAKLKEIVKKIRIQIVAFYRKLKLWLLERMKTTTADDSNAAIDGFLNENRNKKAIEYLSKLSDSPEKIAKELVIYAGGDTAAFESALIDQLQPVLKRAEAIEKKIADVPTHYRVARGSVTISDLFSNAGDEGINSILSKAMTVAGLKSLVKNAVAKATNNDYNDSFAAASRSLIIVTEELDEYEKAFVVNNEASANFGDDKEISFIELYVNLAKAADELKRVSVKQQMDNAIKSFDSVIEVMDDEANDDVFSQLPDSISEQERRSFAAKVAALYNRVGKLGSDIIRLWKVRLHALDSISTVSTSLIGLVESFVAAVDGAKASLDDTQKQKLTKHLVDHGFTIAL